MTMLDALRQQLADTLEQLTRPLLLGQHAEHANEVRYLREVIAAWEEMEAGWEDFWRHVRACPQRLCTLDG